MEIKRPSMKEILERIKPHSSMEEFKKVFIKKIHFITGALSMKDRGGIPTLNDALIYLGQARSRIAMLEELNGMIQRVLCNERLWPQELWALREMSRRQEALCLEAVKAFLYQKEQERQEAEALPQVKDIEWR